MTIDSEAGWPVIDSDEVNVAAVVVLATRAKRQAK